MMNLVLRSGAATWLTLLEDLDCQWSGRLRLREPAPPAARWFWTGITHTGGAAFTVLAVSVPAVVPALASGAANATIGLVASHLLVQFLKRTIVRARPVEAAQAWVALPDRYSFPSGHATASLVVALGWGVAFPALFLPLLILGLLVGLSRVVLGVHHLGDVLAGQAIAILTTMLVAGLR
jgi:undecaprenyl-diphosphatase